MLYKLLNHLKKILFLSKNTVNMPENKFENYKIILQMRGDGYQFN
nr:MAG TPA: hypothetical protein [Caudoviricetes sp.]